MARRTKEEAEETRRLLLKTALRLFSKHGLHKTTLAQIAKEAGVTRGAIYWHFKDKMEMLDALFCDVFTPLYLDFEKQFELYEKEPLKALENIARQFFLEMNKNPKMRQVLSLHQQVHVDDELARLCHESEEEDHKQLAALFSNAMALGQLREGLTVELAVYTFCSFMEGAVWQWLRRGREEPADKLESDINVIVGVMVQGFAR